jgi:hypothetical protein
MNALQRFWLSVVLLTAAIALATYNFKWGHAQGGQAIVGAVHQGGGVPANSEDRPHAPALTHEPDQTLPGDLEAVGEAVPVTRG